MDKYDRHPCFNDSVRHLYGRVHLPVAPRCNVQCNFCDRKFDCVNESRPGVTSAILSPEQALQYLKRVFEKHDNISVVGIAGPGDPFANPEETMETLRLIRSSYPDVILCIATNGLNIEPYIEELSEMNLSHVTITVNAVDPEIASKIYAWIRYGKRIRRGKEAGEIIIEKQISAIKKLKEKGITVKINSIIIPGVNQDHIVKVAEKLSVLGVDIFNAIPLYKNHESNFSHIESPSKAEVEAIRTEAAEYIKQMHHCTRCRADAVGLLGDGGDPELNAILRECGSSPPTAAINEKRSHIAVASMEGVLINQHLGEAEQLMVFSLEGDTPQFLENRSTPPPGGGDGRWRELAEILSDCSAILVNGVGPNPRKILEEEGLKVLELEGVIEAALENLKKGSDIGHMVKRKQTRCRAECSGNAGGCG